MTEPTAFRAPDASIWPEGPDTVGAGLDAGLAGRPARPVAGIDNGFEAGYRGRFEEAGPDGLVRASMLLRYAQDIAWRHSEDRGFDRRWYAERSRWWVVRAVDLRIHAPVRMARTVALGTAVVGHRRIWARRHGEGRTGDGRPVFTIDTDWVIVDDRGRLGRIPEEFGVAFPNPELEGDITRAAIGPTPDGADRLELVVRPHELDPVAHVNNAVYLDWVEEARAAAAIAAGTRTPLDPFDPAPRWVRLEYLASAAPAEAVVVRSWATDRGWAARVERASDGTEFLRAEGGPGEG
jgi:acyl-CoA thioesterase FadM